MSEITLYTAPTANGWKASIALEELGIDYDVEYLHFNKNEQKTPDFLKLNPNGRIPVIVDHDNDDFVLAESGAILLYLAERSGKLWPTDPQLRHQAMQWLMFQMSAVGPMLGQAMFFQRIAAPKGIVDEYAIERYVTESKRLLGVLNDALRDQEYLCGEYSMVDIATFPWARAYRWANVDVSDLTHLTAWLARVEAREAVQRGLCVPAGKPRFDYSDDELTAAAQRNAELYDA
ncbi:MAG: glutathione S-transferase family protein [Desulfurellaceae bacterium]|nr:glutathione S-transferase family protein [Desulfurellaceae bacterium]